MTCLLAPKQALVLGVALFLVPSCLEAGPQAPSNEPAHTTANPADEPLGVTEANWTPRNFSWVSEALLGGMAHPGYGDKAASVVEWLDENSVGLLVSLTVQAPPALSDENHHFAVLHLPITDFTAPSIEQIEIFTEIADVFISRGDPVVVHCGAGMGRTGTMLASWFTTQGMTATEAIAHVRALRPGSIETKSQEAIIADFAD